MRNILCISFYGASWGGSFIPAMLALEQEAAARGVGVTFVFPLMGQKQPWAKSFPDALWIDNRFFLKQDLSLDIISRLVRVVHHRHITDVVTNFVGYSANMRMLHILCRGGYSQVVHNTFHLPSPAWWKRKLKLMLLEDTYNKFIGVSNWVADSLICHGLSACKVSYVNNAVDFQRLAQWENINFRQTPDEVLILMMGWPYYVKGVDLAIRAVRHLRETGVNAILLTPHSNIINDLKEDMGDIPSFVRFVKAREDVATFYNNVDIFLCASREEGLSYAVIEAVCAKCMVLCSDIPSVTRLNIPDMPLFKSEDWQDLYQQLKFSIENKASVLVHKQAQQQYVQQEFDMKQWAKNMLNTILQPV